MLRRDRQIRTLIHEIADLCIFGVSFLLAYILRSDPWIIAWLNLDQSSSFADFAKLFFVLLAGGPLILESQGFYDRPPVSPRRAIFWPLLKGCTLVTVGLIIITFIFHLTVARTIMVAFGCISFCAIWVKEEILRLFLRSKVAQ